jgi:hypothetical protein
MSIQDQRFVPSKEVMRTLFLSMLLQGCALSPSQSFFIEDSGDEEVIVETPELLTSNGPDSVVMEDFDADGIIDIAATNLQSDTIGVFLNKGESQSSLQFGLRNYSAGSSPSGLSKGDLDQDGDIDLVTQNFADGTVKILFNDGQGHFNTSQSMETGRVLLSIEVGDIDGDGWLDIASTGASDSVPYGIFVLYGDGGGVFSPAVAYEIRGPSYGLALGDLNGDGLLDIANSNTGEASISLYLNTGQRCFGAQKTYETGEAPYGVAIADLTGDGAAELITTVTNERSDPDEVTPDLVVVLQNDGAGHFLNLTSYQAGNHPQAITALDLNGDSQLDLAVTNSYGESTSVFLNQGGIFSEALTLPVRLNPFALSGQDLDGNGAIDLVVANRASNSLSVFFGPF